MYILWIDPKKNSSLIFPYPDYQKIFYSQEIEDSRLWWAVKWIDKIFANFTNAFIQFFSENWKLKTIVEKEIEKICEKCVNYNRNRYYGMSNINCQYFVDDILNSIGIKLKFEGQMKRALEYVKENGQLDYIFNDIKFETRKQLDDYVSSINFFSLKEDEQTLLFLYKTTLEGKRLEKINNNENEGIYETTKKAEEMWKNYEIKIKKIKGENKISFL